MTVLGPWALLHACSWYTGIFGTAEETAHESALPLGS